MLFLLLFCNRLSTIGLAARRGGMLTFTVLTGGAFIVVVNRLLLLLAVDLVGG